MRSDIVPGATFPDYELPDHTETPRTLSELQGDDPMVLTLARGHYCPKEHQQHLQLATAYPQFAVAYTQLVTIATDEHHTLQEFRASVGAQWTFLSDPGRIVQRDLDIQEYTDPENDPMIPHTLVLKPGLVVHRVYNGYWFWGRPSVEDLWRDLREVSAEIRPDWDLATPGLRERWDAGDLAPFHGWSKESPGRLTSMTMQRPSAADGRFDVVVVPRRREQSAGVTFEHREARLRRQRPTAPAHAVVLQSAAHAVVGHAAAVEADAASRAEAPGEVAA